MESTAYRFVRSCLCGRSLAGMFRFLCCVGLTSLSVPGSLEAGQVEIVWVLSPEGDTAGYRVCYGSVSRYDSRFTGYPSTVDLRPGDFETSSGKGFYNLNGLSESQTTWVSLTAYDHEGNESGYSNEKKIRPGSVPVVPCQAAPPGAIPVPPAVGLPGWILFMVTVAGWILSRRRRACCRPLPRQWDGRPTPRA